MYEILNEVKAFLNEYEVATNSHIFDNVRPLISNDAVFWFSNGTYVGIKQIETAFNNNFNKIKDEKYTIKDVKWISLETNSAVCIYTFLWKGIVDGKSRQGQGRGTNVLSKIDGKWVLIHEHLSTL